MTVIAAMLALSLSSAGRADLREYCPDRPGLDTPACVIDRGHMSLEVGLADWTSDRSHGESSDRLILGDMLLRYGVSDTAEVQLGWTSFGREVDRDRQAGTRSRQNRTGDATAAIRYNLHNPDGSGFSAALMPRITLPVGRMPIGAGDWAAGLIVPMSDELDDRFSIAFSPEIDAAVDEDGHGRHLAFGGVAGVSEKFGSEVTATAEYQLIRDNDPSGHVSQQLAGLSLGWQPKDDLQLDLGANAGLRHAPDIEIYIGVARRF